MDTQAADPVRSSPVQGKLAKHNAVWDMGCRNDQHERCDFDLGDGKDSISLDTNLTTSFPAHSNAPCFFKHSLEFVLLLICF